MFTLRKIALATIAALGCSLALQSCHDDDINAEVSQLNGVWTAVHYTEWVDTCISRPFFWGDVAYTDENWRNNPGWIDYVEIPSMDGAPVADFDIVQTDEQYTTMMFRGQTITVLATGDYESVDILDIPVGYSIVDGQIFSALFETQYVEGGWFIEDLTDNYFKLVYRNYGWPIVPRADDDPYDSYGVSHYSYTFFKVVDK